MNNSDKGIEFFITNIKKLIDTYDAVTADLYEKRQQEIVQSRLSNKDIEKLEHNKELLRFWLARIEKHWLNEEYHSKIEEEIEGCLSCSKLLEHLNSYLESLRHRELSSKEKEYALKFMCNIVYYIECSHNYSAYVDKTVSDVLWPVWDKALTKLRPDNFYSKYGILVSLGSNFDKIEYPIISCSFVTESHRCFYNLCSDSEYDRADKIGWYFRPTRRTSILGMDMSDAGAVYKRANSEFEEYSAALMDWTGLNNGWIRTAHSSFQACYHPTDMITHGSYNEIVLDGRCRPKGVFIIHRDWENFGDEAFRKAEQVAENRGLPIVSLNWDTGVLAMSPYLS
jgi:hypothetical protein